jgi:hypothetical protein
MKSFHHILLLAGLAIAPLGLFAAASSPAQTVIPAGTFSAPYVISQPGSYVLGGSRLVSDATKNVIHITAPDVTLDLGGFSLAHAGGSNSTGSGIQISATENVEIRNGSIVNAARYGIYAASGKGLRVIDVRVVSARMVGIVYGADSSLIDRCEIADSEMGGIIGEGAGSLVTDCVVSDCGTGIKLSSSRVVRTVVRGGRVGMSLGSSTAVDCAVTGGTTVGVFATPNATLRNVELMNNAVGVFAVNTSVVIFGSRITHNTTKNVEGTFTNGGGNVIQ